MASEVAILILVESFLQYGAQIPIFIGVSGRNPYFSGILSAIIPKMEHDC